MLPLFWTFCVRVCEISAKRLRNRTVTFSSGLNILGFDDNGSNSVQESSPSEESTDSRDHFSANELRTSKKMAQRMVSHPYGSRRGVRTRSCDRSKISTQQTQNEHTWGHHPIFQLFPKSESITCSTRQVIAFWIQTVSFLQLPHASPRPADKHSCGVARLSPIAIQLAKMGYTF